MRYQKELLLIFLIHLLVFSQLFAQQILSGPYLIEPGETEMTIRWELDSRADYIMEYGKSISKVKSVNLIFRESKHDGHLYEVVLSDLKANTTYNYHLISKDGDKWSKFKTYSNKQSNITFVAMGDSRSNPDIFSKILDRTSGEHPDFVISMGDLVEVGGAYVEWNKFYFSVAKDFLGSTPLVSTLGDHETNGDDGELFRYFLRKDQAVDKLWFSYDYGIAHFISLDYRHADNQEMMDWFIKDITTSGKKWNFVYMHRGAYNFGGHRTDWGRENWPELFSKHKVDIVFAGHSHLYERFYPVREENKTNAVTYITTGGAGAGLYQSVKNETVVAITESVNNFVTVHIDDNTLKLKATRMDGSLLDELEIVKNKNGYNTEYEDQIISQVEINTITGFNSAISRGLNSIPLFQEPAKYKLNLQSYTSEAIPFSIQLNDESAETYILEPLQGTLQGIEKKELILNITRDEDMTIHPWGNFDPELRFKLIYEHKSKSDTIIGKAINYWPDTN